MFKGTVSKDIALFFSQYLNFVQCLQSNQLADKNFISC
jgi:hypothetical protein